MPFLQAVEDQPWPASSDPLLAARGVRRTAPKSAYEQQQKPFSTFLCAASAMQSADENAAPALASLPERLRRRHTGLGGSRADVMLVRPRSKGTNASEGDSRAATPPAPATTLPDAPNSGGKEAEQSTSTGRRKYATIASSMNLTRVERHLLKSGSISEQSPEHTAEQPTAGPPVPASQEGGEKACRRSAPVAHSMSLPKPLPSRQLTVQKDARHSQSCRSVDSAGHQQAPESPLCQVEGLEDELWGAIWGEKPQVNEATWPAKTSAQQSLREQCVEDDADADVLILPPSSPCIPSAGKDRIRDNDNTAHCMPTISHPRSPYRTSTNSTTSSLSSLGRLPTPPSLRPISAPSHPGQLDARVTSLPCSLPGTPGGQSDMFSPPVTPCYSRRAPSPLASPLLKGEPPKSPTLVAAQAALGAGRRRRPRSPAQLLMLSGSSWSPDVPTIAEGAHMHDGELNATAAQPPPSPASQRYSRRREHKVTATPLGRMELLLSCDNVQVVSQQEFRKHSYDASTALRELDLDEELLEDYDEPVVPKKALDLAVQAPPSTKRQVSTLLRSKTSRVS